jgi:NHL repeat
MLGLIAFLRRVSCIGLVASALTACSPFAERPAYTPPGSVRAYGGGKSWVVADAKRLDLLYVSYAGAVYVYSYPQGKLKGTLGGFSSPRGLCVDSAGDVWITDYNEQQIVEYAHGGTEPIAMLSDADERPIDCSVDPTTGDLAVSNVYTTPPLHRGSVLIFPQAQGTPQTYVVPGMYNVCYLAYGADGSLFTDGLDFTGYQTVFADLPKSARSFRPVLLDQQVVQPGGVQWDGQRMTVTNTIASVYRVRIKRLVGKRTGTVSLGGTSTVGQYWIQGHTLIGPTPVGGFVGFWKYPQGGAAYKTITGFSKYYGPVGSAVSMAESPSTSGTVRRLFASASRAGSSPRVFVPRRRAWVNPDAKNKQFLLYISDAGTGSVKVYDYKTETLLGETEGFALPYGECSDKSGNVYVVDFDLSEIFEFKYGHTTPSRSLADGLGYPIGCSINPKTGDLAVTNYFSYGSLPGAVLIYKNASGYPTQYAAAYYDWPPSYDPEGDLFVEGTSAGCGPYYTTCLEEFPSGGSRFSPIALSGATIGFSAAVEWDGKYLALGDQSYQGQNLTAVYQTAVSGSTATVVSTTVMSGTCDGSANNIVQWAFGSARPNDLPTKSATQVIGGNLWCKSYYGFWAYPKSGENDPVMTMRYGTAPVAADGQTLVRHP